MIVKNPHGMFVQYVECQKCEILFPAKGREWETCPNCEARRKTSESTYELNSRIVELETELDEEIEAHKGTKQELEDVTTALEQIKALTEL